MLKLMTIIDGKCNEKVLMSLWSDPTLYIVYFLNFRKC